MEKLHDAACTLFRVAAGTNGRSLPDGGPIGKSPPHEGTADKLEGCLRVPVTGIFQKGTGNSRKK